MSSEPPISESSAYAVAAWSRFDEEVTDRLLRALTGTFALVAVSDGDLATEETNRFFALLRTRANLFPGLDFDAVEHGFKDVCEALLSDPSTGRQRALGYIGSIKDTASHCQLVLAAAHIAAEADERERAAERQVLQDIRDLLGVR
ncbi:MAG: TerB family tellurite resistance protein [Pseudomonadales bacterium]